MKTMEPLLDRGYSLFSDGYYNSPSLGVLIRNHGINVAGTFHLNRKNFPAFMKMK
jgi:hypothetical protein